MSLRRVSALAALAFAWSALALGQPFLMLGNLPGLPWSSGTNLGLGTDGAVRVQAVGFRTGAESLNVLSATALVSNPTPASVLSAAIHDDAAGNPGALLFAFDPAAIAENLPATEVALAPASGGIVLDPDTSYWLVFSGPATPQSLRWHGIDPNASPTPAPGIAFLGYRFSSNGGAAWAPLSLFTGVAIYAQPAGAPAVLRVAMPDSTNNRMVLFNPNDGALVDGDWFALQAGTPIHPVQVGNEIWVSEQVGDRVGRFDLDGVFLGQLGGGPTGGLDNIRGMAIVGNELWVTNSGTQNGAPGAALVRFSLAGAPLGSIATGTTSSSPFAILPRPGDVLVASSNANDDIHRYDSAGASLGTFHNSTGLNFAQQMDVGANGDILAAGFSTNTIVRLDAATGALLGSITAAGSRGVYQLGNGNILWSNSAGVHVYDVASLSSSLVYPGGGRHFGPVLLPAGVVDIIFVDGFEGALARP